jgi:hypothetical protein
MSLIEQMKARVRDAMKARRTVEREVLGVALGEIQTEEARGEKSGDALAIAVLRKLVKSDQETLAAAEDPEQRRILEEELVVLRSLLPQTLDVETILEALSPVADAVRAANNDGQATGVAMKHLKSTGAAVEGKDVAEAVRRLRS